MAVTLRTHILSDAAAVERLPFALASILHLPLGELTDEIGVAAAVIKAWAEGTRRPSEKYRAPLVRTFCRATKNPKDRAAHLRVATAVLYVVYGTQAEPRPEEPLDVLFRALLTLKAGSSDHDAVYTSFRSTYRPWSRLLSTNGERAAVEASLEGRVSVKFRTFVDIARRLQADLGGVSLQPLASKSAAEREEYLLSLPGVGQTTARLTMLLGFGDNVLPVDGDVYRVAVRLGIVPHSTSVRTAQETFDPLVPVGLASRVYALFAAHADERCVEAAPKCGECPLAAACQYAKLSADPRTPPAASAVGPTRRPAAGPVAIDLYAGCGGLSSGLRDAGFDVRYALDWDRHACLTHAGNFPEAEVACADVRTISAARVRDAAGSDIALVAGGPNCQGVSERGLRSPHDPRNFMFPEFVRFVSDLRPRAFLMENVPGLAHRHNYPLMRGIFDAFQSLGYRCAADVLLAADYGVPQLRYRFFLIGTLEPVELSFPTPTHEADVRSGLFRKPYVTVREAIGDLPHIGPEQQAESLMPYADDGIDGDFRRYVREGSDGVRNHVCSATAAINLRRAEHVPEGGNWKDIPAHLLPDRFFACRMTDHSTTYARLRWDQPAFTITSLFGNITAGAFTHPVVSRALSIREGARIQSFRDTFAFHGPRNSQYRQIGNAVPPLLAKAVGTHLRRLLAGEAVDGVRPRIATDLLEHEGAWDSLPVLTPRFKQLFGTGTRWPKGWGQEPANWREKIDENYTLLPQHRPAGISVRRRRHHVKEVVVS